MYSRKRSILMQIVEIQKRFRIPFKQIQETSLNHLDYCVGVYNIIQN